MRPQGVSVIICCHNGANRLPETIRHLARQRVAPWIPWEVVIIDNGSTDASALVARLEWQKHRVDTDLNIVAEPRLGLSFARARGFQEARYEYMVLCDDDNWLSEQYVDTVYQILSDNKDIGAVGGVGRLVYEVDPPSRELSFIFAAGPQAPVSGKVPESKLYGAGCAIRHSAYHKMLGSGFKSLLTDRRGVELSSGGDYELCLALAILGYDIWYDDRLKFVHYITRERLTWQYFERYAYESSKCFNVITSYKVVAGSEKKENLATVVVLRNFLVCSKILFSVSLRRLMGRRDDKVLQFRQLHFKYKLLAYFQNFSAMVQTHRRILAFQRSCRPSQHVLKPLRKDLVPLFKFSFFSRPSRQLR